MSKVEEGTWGWEDGGQARLAFEAPFWREGVWTVTKVCHKEKHTVNDPPCGRPGRYHFEIERAVIIPLKVRLHYGE